MNKGLLTPTERRQFRIISPSGRHDCSYWDIDGLLQAQLDKAKPLIEQETAKRIFKEIEEASWEEYSSIRGKLIIMREERYQQLKKKFLGGKE